MGSISIRDEGLGAAFELDERFVDAGFGRDEELPSSHLIASEPHAGRIAALAVVTVRADLLEPEAWLARQVARARASFAPWSPETHEMLVAPGPASLAGRPAVHVRYRLLPRALPDAVDAQGAPPPDADAVPPPDAQDADAGSVPASFVEHWTLLVEERQRLLVVEMMVQPPAWWDEEHELLELPFRTLELI